LYYTFYGPKQGVTVKLSDKQISRMIHFIMKELKEQNLLVVKSDESKVVSKAKEIVKNNIFNEQELDNEVNLMMDGLERQHPGEFQRYKMFPMLKKKLAKEKGFVL